ncbi:hypothetical protein TNCV_4079351 [Trichonephila clavipes]|nr:hypothetical protein TNCV_4079351 [Trichonephila clavipes]
MATGSYMTLIYSRSQSEVLGDLHKRWDLIQSHPSKSLIRPTEAFLGASGRVLVQNWPALVLLRLPNFQSEIIFEGHISKKLQRMKRGNSCESLDLMRDPFLAKNCTAEAERHSRHRGNFNSVENQIIANTDGSSDSNLDKNGAGIYFIRPNGGLESYRIP